MVFVSRSRLGRGGLTQFCTNLLRYRTGDHFRSEKNHPEMGQAPTSQARPRDTDHMRPSNSAARTLSFVEHTISKFGGDPCPVRRGLAAAGKCYVRKARFFLCVWAADRDDPSLQMAHLAGFSTMKGKPVLFPVFGYNNCWSECLLFLSCTGIIPYLVPAKCTAGT